MTPCIRYRDGYKYQTCDAYRVVLPFAPDRDIRTEYIAFTVQGELIIRTGYAWDGPSGPTVDTRNFMRGSLEHDALYQLTRERHLSAAVYRPLADRRLYDCCREDGMSAVRAYWVWLGVRWGGGPACDPANCKPVLVAP